MDTLLNILLEMAKNIFFHEIVINSESVEQQRGLDKKNPEVFRLDCKENVTSFWLSLP